MSESSSSQVEAAVHESIRREDAVYEGSMIEHLDVPYGRHSSQKIDFYQSSKVATMKSRPPILIFIHGGAWRTGSRKDHTEMARRLIAICDGGVTVALVDYRLTQPKPLTQWSDATRPVKYDNRHPKHIKDIYNALRFLLLTPNDEHAGQRKSDEGQAKEMNAGERYCFDDKRAILMGHSVGAWLATAVLLDPCVARWNEESQVPELGTVWEREDLIPKINAWILVDGIYDLISLLDEYPSYRDFVSQAFPLDKTDIYGSEADQLRRGSITSWKCRDNDYCARDGPHVYILHSTHDELLSLRQSEEAEAYITRELASRFDGQARDYGLDLPWESAQVEFKTGPWGGHDDMLNVKDVLDIVARVTLADSNRVEDKKASRQAQTLTLDLSMAESSPPAQ